MVILIAISLYLHETIRLGRYNWTTLAANQLTDRYKDTNSLQGRNFLRQCGSGGSIDFCVGGIPSSIQYSVPNGWKCKEEMPYCPAPNCVHRCHVHCRSLLRSHHWHVCTKIQHVNESPYIKQHTVTNLISDITELLKDGRTDNVKQCAYLWGILPFNSKEVVNI